MDFQNVHILFCDHDASSGSETLSLLQSCSYKVTAVKSAREVVEVLKSDNSDVDLVLTDVELPQEEGFKMLKHILRQENLGHIAVVVMSEHDEMAVVAKCLHLGAVDYLVKPLRLNEVMNLWTHMWRKRRMMGLPNKNVGLTRMNLSANFRKPETADLLSGYRNAGSPIATIQDARHTDHSKDHAAPQLELSLRLSSNYTPEKLPEQADFASAPSYHSSDGREHPSAFSTYLKSHNVQPDEQSGTNACSLSSPPSKRSKCSNECAAGEDWKSAGEVPADTSLSSQKDASVADETRPGDMESQIYDGDHQNPVDQVPTQCIATDERIVRPCTTNAQGFQPHYAFVGSSAVHMLQGVRANVQVVSASGYSNPVLNPSHVPQLPPFRHESGMANVPPVANAFSYYPVAHLAVPVVNFSTWPALVAPTPLVGGKLIQAERREAALSKFRMKRKGRCFEKKIRYASRKKLAEQRPRVRGQFVKRSALIENTITEAVSDEEGEADDEQGCSELDNSSPDCIAENCIVG